MEHSTVLLTFLLNTCQVSVHGIRGDVYGGWLALAADQLVQVQVQDHQFFIPIPVVLFQGAWLQAIDLKAE